MQIGDSVLASVLMVSILIGQEELDFKMRSYIYIYINDNQKHVISGLAKPQLTYNLFCGFMGFSLYF